MDTMTPLEISLDPREISKMSNQELGMLVATLDHWQELHVVLRKATLTEQLRRRRAQQSKQRGAESCSAY